MRSIDHMGRCGVRISIQKTTLHHDLEGSTTTMLERFDKKIEAEETDDALRSFQTVTAESESKGMRNTCFMYNQFHATSARLARTFGR